MSKFIKLTGIYQEDQSKPKSRINVDAIAIYSDAVKHGRTSLCVVGDDDPRYFMETPEEIDKLILHEQRKAVPPWSGN